MKKLILVVVDGLTAQAFEDAVADGLAPTLAQLAGEGRYRRSLSVFPSLTPVCLSSLATGAGPDVHEIPHLVWWHRGERRLVEYGSSFGALRAAGLTRSLHDTIIDMNRRHLGAGATTLFEALEDAGLVPAVVNFTCYRGRTRHEATLPGVPSVLGPRRFFFYNLFESDPTGAPLAVRNRAAGTVDDYAEAVGRWLVTRDGFDLLVYYLSDYDFASHALGPDAARRELARADARVGTLAAAAGGLAEFLERYAVVVCSDHGQTPVREAARLQDAFAGLPGVRVTASNRAAMVYGDDARALAERLVGHPAVDVAAFLEDGELVAQGDVDAHPDGRARLLSALRNPNAGEVVVSATPGWEFWDGGGRHHAGGGSHGSLVAGDSEVPMLTVGLAGEAASITDVAPLALGHFGLGVRVAA
ncbi:MAG: alkaline phosphatase family protein [Gaiellaceae bacterium]